MCHEIAKIFLPLITALSAQCIATICLRLTLATSSSRHDMLESRPFHASFCVLLCIHPRVAELFVGHNKFLNGLASHYISSCLLSFSATPTCTTYLSNVYMSQRNEITQRSYKRVDDVVPMPMPMPIWGSNSQAQARIQCYAIDAQRETARQRTSRTSSMSTVLESRLQAHTA